MTSNTFLSKLKFKHLTGKRNKSNGGSSYDIVPLNDDDGSAKQVTLKRYLKLKSEDFAHHAHAEEKLEGAVHNPTESQSSERVDIIRPQTHDRTDSSKRDRWSEPTVPVNGDKIASMVHSVSLHAPLAYPENDAITVDETDLDMDVSESTVIVNDSTIPEVVSHADIGVEPGYQSIDEVKEQIAQLRHHKGAFGEEKSVLTNVNSGVDSHDSSKKDDGSSHFGNHHDDHSDIEKLCSCTFSKSSESQKIKDQHCCADSGVDSPGILSSSPQSQSTCSRYNSNNSSVLSETDFPPPITTTAAAVTSTNVNNTTTTYGSAESEKHPPLQNEAQVFSYSTEKLCHTNSTDSGTSVSDHKRNIEELYAVPNKRHSRDISSSDIVGEANKLSVCRSAVDEADKLSIATGDEADKSSIATGDEADKLSIAAGHDDMEMDWESNSYIDDLDDEPPPPLPERAYGSLPSSPTVPHSVALAEHSSNPELWMGAGIKFSHEERIHGQAYATDTKTVTLHSHQEVNEGKRLEFGHNNHGEADVLLHSDLVEEKDQEKWLYEGTASDHRNSLSRSVPEIQRRKLPSPPHAPRGHRRSSSSGKNAVENGEPKCVDFFESLRLLKECGWYWGPLSWDDAEAKLTNKPDGSFLVRDSSDERYILSLSFTSQGSTHHTRIEHHKGLFSFYSQPRSHGCGTIVEFIERAMAHSRDGKFLYFLRPRAQGFPPVPLQLLHPISRFQTMRSLQHMCRFVILKYVRKDHISRLPLPSRTKDYLMESQYYAENIDEDGESTDSTLTEN